MDEDQIKKEKLDLPKDAEEKLKAILSGGLKEGSNDNTSSKESDTKGADHKRDQTFDTPAVSVDPKVFDNPANSVILDKIDVTDNEKEIFFEALLHDQPFQLDIPVFKDSTAVIRSRNTYEQSLCYECVQDMLNSTTDLVERSKIDILLWLQRFSCTVAVVKFLDVEQHPLLFHDTDDEKIRKEHKEQLVATAKERFANMAYPKWQAILTAFMIFTVKEKLLLDGVGNRDFWNPVG